MKWISVKDRLPDKNIDVLVTDGKSRKIAYYLPQYKTFDCPGEFKFSMVVTHWMSLPELPKGE